MSASGGSDSSDEADGWQPTFVAITDREIRLVLILKELKRWD